MIYNCRSEASEWAGAGKPFPGSSPTVTLWSCLHAVIMEAVGGRFGSCVGSSGGSGFPGEGTRQGACPPACTVPSSCAAGLVWASAGRPYLRHGFGWRVGGRATSSMPGRRRRAY